MMTIRNQEKQITKCKWLLQELDRRVKLNEEEGLRLENELQFESARYYFGGAGALRELAIDAALVKCHFRPKQQER